MSFKSHIFALMNAGGSTSIQPVEMNDEGQLKVDAEVTVGTVSITGALTSAVVVGPTVPDVSDDASAPIQTGGISRTANPTAVGNGDVVKATYDDLGRMLVQPIQVRDLLQTAYASVTNITETALLAGAASTFHDLIYIIAANNSNAAVNIDIRHSTGGTVQMGLSIPAGGTVALAPPVPIPQEVVASAWTFQNAASDDSTTTIEVTALFAKNV